MHTLLSSLESSIEFTLISVCSQFSLLLLVFPPLLWLFVEVVLLYWLLVLLFVFSLLNCLSPSSSESEESDEYVEWIEPDKSDK